MTIEITTPARDALNIWITGSTYADTLPDAAFELAMESDLTDELVELGFLIRKGSVFVTTPAGAEAAKTGVAQG